MGSPGLRSSEELRAFYAIALQAKSFGVADGSTKCLDTHSILSQSSAFTANSQNQPGSSGSLFSAQSQTASSATSISEDKGPATLVTGPRVDRSCMPGVHPNPSRFYLTSEEEDTDLPPQSCHTEGIVSRIGDDIREDLSALRSFRVDLSCQQCRIHKLGCDRASPSCWNCVQTYQQCYYGRNETSNTEANLISSEIRIPKVPELPSWGDSLRDHPYYSLEGSGRLGRVGMWSLKLRHDIPLTSTSSKNLPGVDAENALGDDDKLLLMRKSPVPFGDRDLSFMEDVIDDTSSLASSPSTFIRSSSWSLARTSHDSGLTIPLDLGMGLNLAKPTQNDEESVLSSSECNSRASWEEGPDCIVDEFTTDPRPPSTKGYPNSCCSSSFHCIFCFQRFDCRERWEEHEQSEHFNAQKDWICMPWGATEESEDGYDVCVFCGVINPTDSHFLQHRDEPCRDQLPRNRTFRSRGDFQEHLWNEHNQPTITEWMESWSYLPKDDAWYWECGFCDRLLARWSDRVTHIGNHFKAGMTMSCWNPLVPPYPIDKTTGSHISWFSTLQWDPKELLTLQLSQHNQSHSHPASKQHQCHCCSLDFGNEEDVNRHQEVWHFPHNVWSCPTMDDIRTATSLQTGPVSWYLFQKTSLPTACEEDVCPYCGDLSDIIFEDYGEDITECFADWDIRIKHLKDEHNIDKCQPGLKFDRADQFLLHLAGSHNIKLTDWTKDILDSCKRMKEIVLDSAQIPRLE